ncbi:hypothetical protein CHUAL_007730 [Chamberlinius hualienensis]
MDSETDYSSEFSKDLQLIARRDLNEDDNARQKSLQELRRWIENHSNIVQCRTDAKFLLRFLRSKKFHIQSATEMLERYLIMRNSHPKWYTCLDIADSSIEALIDKGFVFVLPERDLNGRRVIFSIGNAVNTSGITDGDTMRAMVMTFETLLEDEDNQILGFTYVFESRGVGLSALSIWSPTNFQKAFSTSEKAFPMRHKEVHFVHLPFIINAGFQVFKSFLSEKLRNRLMAHRDFTEMSSFIPQKILPKEYGGELPVAEMIRNYTYILLKTKTMEARTVQQERNAAQTGSNGNPN